MSKKREFSLWPIYWFERGRHGWSFRKRNHLRACTTRARKAIRKQTPMVVFRAAPVIITDYVMPSEAEVIAEMVRASEAIRSPFVGATAAEAQALSDRYTTTGGGQ